ncbi:Mycobacterium terramassiliense ORFan [Mycobacterium terramassiliense]|uniref:Mycobacterium terramassiliense ORFan n=1 Tax=Mycobacterium terramassiliense TaxID=1841859 RepID=A0A2U3NFM4_9MYCO|nr:Mycobacterium terramassiliense ORFan [Mycobacterium terramassiliense]
MLISHVAELSSILTLARQEMVAAGDSSLRISYPPKKINLP